MNDSPTSNQKPAREVDSKGNCSKCGGTHYGSFMCPMNDEMLADIAASNRANSQQAVELPASNPRCEITGSSKALCQHCIILEQKAEVERLRAELSDLGNPKAGVGYWVAECERLRGIEREYFQIHEAIGKLRDAQDQFMMDATRPADETDDVSRSRLKAASTPTTRDETPAVTVDVPKLQTDLELAHAAINRVYTGRVRDMLRLLSDNEISSARAHEWLTAFVRDGVDRPMPGDARGISGSAPPRNKNACCENEHGEIERLTRELAEYKSRAENAEIRQVEDSMRRGDETPAVPADGTIDGDGVWGDGKWHPYRNLTSAPSAACGAITEDSFESPVPSAVGAGLPGKTNEWHVEGGRVVKTFKGDAK